MRILILDDERVRQDALASRFVGHEVVQAWNAPAAIRFLEAGPRFDLVLLDHDLGSGAGTGAEVTCFVARGMEEGSRPREAVVHSHNRPGAQNMLADLREAGVRAVYRPFRAG